MSELVTDYMEGATPLRTRVEMWLHLWRCEACRRYFDQLRRTTVLLGSGPHEPPTQQTEEGLVAIVRGQRRRDP
jgi:predicted anti-sigma-YlaC factor YlaD